MIVVDTYTIIRDALDWNKLTPKAREAIGQVESELFICDISIWKFSCSGFPEMTALSAKGLLTVGVSTTRSPLWSLALSFRRLDGLPQDQSLILGRSLLLISPEKRSLILCGRFGRGSSAYAGKTNPAEMALFLLKLRLGQY